MRTLSTDSLVLKSADYGEYDRLYILYTQAAGKLIARGHGTRRSKNLVAGHLLPFLPARLLLKERQGIWTIIEAEAADYYDQTSYPAVARLHLVAELIDAVTVTNEPDQAIYEVLVYASRLLRASHWWQLSFAEVVAKVLAVLGVAPSTHYCVLSGQPIDPARPVYWSGLLGGTVQNISTQSTKEPFYRLQTVDTLKLIKVLMGRLPVAHRVSVQAAVAKEAEYVLLEYMQIHVQQNLAALPFLHRQTADERVY